MRVLAVLRHLRTRGQVDQPDGTIIGEVIHSWRVGAALSWIQPSRIDIRVEEEGFSQKKSQNPTTRNVTHCSRGRTLRGGGDEDNIADGEVGVKGVGVRVPREGVGQGVKGVTGSRA